MGNISSHSKVGYEELRNSIPGSMLADQDFDLFYSLCKIETIGSLTTVVHPSPTQLFYVVVSGQVVVHLSSSKVPNVCATTFSAGDMIHFFNCNIKPVTQLDNSCIVNGNIKLSFHFKGYTEKMGRVIGMDRRGWDVFMRTRMEHKKPLLSLLSINIADFVKSSNYFETLTQKQIQMLGPLLKIRLAAKGNAICFPSKQNAGLAKNFTSVGTVAVVLSGSCLSIPVAQDVGSLTDKLLKESPHSASMRSMPKQSSSIMYSITRMMTRANRSRSGSIHRSPDSISRNSRIGQHSGHHNGAGHGDRESNSVRSNQSGLVSLSLSDSSKLNSSLSLQAGAVLGLDSFLVREPAVPMRKYLATSSLCIVGYIYPKLLDALCQVDPRLQRVLARNYSRILLTTVRFTVPMLSGMDDVAFAKLSSKVVLKGFAAGSIIYERDQTSDFAYIVLAGAVSLTSLLSREDEGQMAERLDQVLTWGNMFGDMALVSSSPYFNTATAAEPTVTMAISKRTLDEIYFDNKSKLCEIRIKLVGTEVDILHVIDHPRGSELFRAFLAKVMAVENLEFYHAVDRFDSMCVTVAKLYFEIKKLRSKLDLSMIRADGAAVPHDAEAEHEHMPLEPIAEAGPTLPRSHAHAQSHNEGAKADTNTGTKATYSTITSAAVVDPYEADAQLNSAYMAKLFAEFDTNNTATVDTPSPENLASYQTDEEDGGDKNARNAHAMSPFEHLFVRQNSDSNASQRSGLSDDEGDVFPRFSVKYKPTSAKQEEPSGEPQTAQDSPFSALNLTVNTSETPKTRMTKTTILREKLNLFSPKQDPRTHPTEQEQIEGLIQSGVSAHASGATHSRHALTREQNQALYDKVHRRLAKLRQGIIELREVAKAIMDTFVFEGAPNQVNLSSKTRNRMEKTFCEWSIAGLGSSYLIAMTEDSPSAHGERSTAAAAAASTTSAIAGERLLVSTVNNSPNVQMFPDNVNVNFTTLFEEAKNEVLKLLRHDNFPRWKRTPEFLSFIDSVKLRDHNVTSEKLIGSYSYDHSSVANIPGLGVHRGDPTLGSNSGSDKGGFAAVSADGAGGNMNLFSALSSKFTSSGKSPETNTTPLISPQRKLSAGFVFSAVK